MALFQNNSVSSFQEAEIIIAVYFHLEVSLYVAVTTCPQGFGWAHDPKETTLGHSSDNAVLIRADEQKVAGAQGAQVGHTCHKVGDALWENSASCHLNEPVVVWNMLK